MQAHSHLSRAPRASGSRSLLLGLLTGAILFPLACSSPDAHEPRPRDPSPRVARSTTTSAPTPVASIETDTSDAEETGSLDAFGSDADRTAGSEAADHAGDSGTGSADAAPTSSSAATTTADSGATTSRTAGATTSSTADLTVPVDALRATKHSDADADASAPASAATSAPAPAPMAAKSAAPAAPAAAQKPAGKPVSLALAARPDDGGASRFGAPLVVNGKRVGDEAIRLYLVYGPGRLMLEMYKLGVVIDDQIERVANELADAEIARREAEKPFASAAERQAAFDAELRQQKAQAQERYRLSETDYQEEHDDTIKQFREKYPVLDIEAEISRAFRTVEWYGIQLRQTMMFDLVFLPPNPEEWPIVSVEAMRADSGDALLDDAKTSYKTRLGMMEKNNLKKIPKDDPMIVTMMRQIVRDAMFNLIDFRTQPDAPPGIALWADTNGDGKPELELTIDELWKKVEPTVSETEIAEAKQWFVTSIATRDREEKEGILVDGDACRASIDEFVKRFDNTYNTLEVYATRTLMFPCVEAYKEYHCLFEGFKNMTEPKLASGPGGDLAAPLREYFDRANRIMGLGQVDSEVMLFSALDIPHFRWKPDGWAWAERESKKVKAAIDANTQAYNEQKAKELEAKQNGTTYVADKPAVEPYRFWSQMIDDHSEYWDPPAPEGQGQKGSDVMYKKKGRFGPRYRNDLISFVGETYFTNWVTGESLTDYLFFDQAEGTVAGPFKGPQGWYLTRVNKRTGASRPLNLAEPKHVELLRDDYLRVAFNKYSKEAVEQATVAGL